MTSLCVCVCAIYSRQFAICKVVYCKIDSCLLAVKCFLYIEIIAEFFVPYIYTVCVPFVQILRCCLHTVATNSSYCNSNVIVIISGNY